MGRKKITRNDRRKARFNSCYKRYKYMMGLTDEQIAKKKNISRQALYNRKNKIFDNMDLFLEVAATCSEDEILAIVRGE